MNSFKTVGCAGTVEAIFRGAFTPLFGSVKTGANVHLLCFI